MIVLLVIIGVFLFGFVIFFHEFGHFITAKASGIRVNEFAIGMGPKLFSFFKGETQYSLRLLPIGGFCSMEGEDEDSKDERAFNNKPVWRRILVVAAGGIFNIILGFFLSIIFVVSSDSIGTNVIAKFEDGSAIQAAGAQVGDSIIEIDGYAVYTDKDLSFAMALADPDAVSIKVRRDGEAIDLGTVALNTETSEDGSESLKIDFWVAAAEKNALTVIGRAGLDTWTMARMVIVSLKGLVTGRFGFNDLAGPVGTAQAITQAASIGLQESFGAAVQNILYMIILITVNLGIVNLMPLPALDGGRLLFLLWELVSRRPVPQKYEGYVHAAGFVLLIGFMVVITAGDIWRIVTGTAI